MSKHIRDLARRPFLGLRWRVVQRTAAAAAAAAVQRKTDVVAAVFAATVATIISFANFLPRNCETHSNSECGVGGVCFKEWRRSVLDAIALKIIFTTVSLHVTPSLGHFF